MRARWASRPPLRPVLARYAQFGLPVSVSEALEGSLAGASTEAVAAPGTAARTGSIAMHTGQLRRYRIGGSQTFPIARRDP